MTEEKEKILSISEYIDFLNSGLKEYRAKIIGEVTEAKSGPTGHVYFTLKDEKDGAILNCIIWRSNYSLYGIGLQEGMKIIATGTPSVYPQYGKLSFIADIIELEGEGALKKEYEKLKKKLIDEGLFASERKRPLPLYAQKIGLITSKKGAVLGDFLSNIGSFGFKIKMIDSRVEGQEALRDLLAAIEAFKKEDIELLAIIRGGGSKENLEVFNNETLVRQVANFPKPTIVAIGHHRDEPLIDFVADVSVSTPTAVATAIGKSWNELLLVLERYEKEIFGRYGEILENYRNVENKLQVSLQNFKNAALNAKINLDNNLKRILTGFNDLLARTGKNLDYVEKAIALNNPERQLKLGYSIASFEGKIIRQIKDVKIGDEITLQVADGNINSQVKNICQKKKQI
jgi:exodeoxyribonuclease VII large subunit